MLRAPWPTHGHQRKPVVGSVVGFVVGSVVGGLAEAAGIGLAMTNPEDGGGTIRSRRGLSEATYNTEAEFVSSDLCKLTPMRSRGDGEGRPAEGRAFADRRSEQRAGRAGEVQLHAKTGRAGRRWLSEQRELKRLTGIGERRGHRVVVAAVVCAAGKNSNAPRSAAAGRTRPV